MDVLMCHPQPLTVVRALWVFGFRAPRTMNDDANKRFTWDKAEYEVKAKERLTKTLEDLKANKFGRTGAVRMR